MGKGGEALDFFRGLELSNPAARDASQTSRRGLFPPRGLAGWVWTEFLLDRLEHVCGGCSVAVTTAHLGVRHLALPVENERRGISGFVFRVPSQVVRFGERVVRVEHESKVLGVILPFDEFVCLVFELVAGAGVYENDGRSGFFERVGLSDVLGDLSAAKGALVARVAPQHDEYDRACVGQFRQFHRVPHQGGKFEVFRFIADGGRLVFLVGGTGRDARGRGRTAQGGNAQDQETDAKAGQHLENSEGEQKGTGEAHQSAGVGGVRSR